jgi:hypothetical protein
MALVGIGWIVLRSVLAPLPVVRSCWRIIIAGAIMGAFVHLAHPLGRLHVIAVIVIAAGLYAGALLALGAIDAEERRLALGSLPSRRGARAARRLAD